MLNNKPEGILVASPPTEKKGLPGKHHPQGKSEPDGTFRPAKRAAHPPEDQNSEESFKSAKTQEDTKAAAETTSEGDNKVITAQDLVTKETVDRVRAKTREYLKSPTVDAEHQRDDDDEDSVLKKLNDDQLAEIKQLLHSADDSIIKLHFL